MTIIEIDNPSIEENYSAYEIKLKFLYFLEHEMKQKKVELYEITVRDLPKRSKDRLKDIDNLNFIDY